MGIIATFKNKVDKFKAEADERATRRIALAKTQAEREKERARIQKERLATKKEIAEAQTALLKAEASRKRAAKEVKDIGDGIFSSLRHMLQPRKTRKRRVTRRKRVKKITKRR